MAVTGVSPDGVGFIERHEGVVLRAYRDVAGVWTIGAGLTAASGVVTPRAGMQIPAAEASALLARALSRSYVPATLRAMQGANQHELDGGVSFHFNTGAIGRASWVEAWRARDLALMHNRILRWNRAGGRVLKGLQRRREDESRLIRAGLYGAATATAPAAQEPGLARITLDLDAAELKALRAGLAQIGYDPGDHSGGIARTAVTAFQRDHDLTVDGIFGRATQTTLQRRMDARRKTGATIGAGAVAGAAEPMLNVGQHGGVVLAVVAGAVAISVLRLGWMYRDVLAAKVAGRLPALARWLRSR